MGNAIKFTDAREVVVKASANKGTFNVPVRDTGPGVSPGGKIWVESEVRQGSAFAFTLPVIVEQPTSPA